MHINASDILAREVGASTDFVIKNETPELADLKLTAALNGELRLVKTDQGLTAGGKVSGQIELECHRCLRAFEHPIAVTVKGEFANRPEPDQWPIATDGTIDVAPMIRQEIILNLPIKAICQPDCLGLCEVCGQRQAAPHHHRDQPIRSNIRITKGRN